MSDGAALAPSRGGFTLDRLRPLLALAAMMVVWEVAVRGLSIREFYLPPISAVLADIWKMQGLYAQSVLRTGLETVLGFIAGSLFGLACGIVFAHARFVERMFFPFFVVSQTIPVIAFGALIVIWFGNGILAKVVIAFYLTFFPVTVNTLRGLLSVDEQRIALLRSFGAGQLKLFVKLRFPYALPSIFVAFRLGISLSLIGSIVGEWFGDTIGLGVMLLQAMFTESMPRLWGIVVVCGVLGTSLYGLIALIEKRVVWWRVEI